MTIGTGEPAPWSVLIGHLVLAQQRLQALRPVLDFGLPEVAASEEAIAAVEERFGPLEGEYRDFLAHADGWGSFWLSTTLLGTAALLAPENKQVLRRYFEECEIEPEEVELDQVVAISTDRDSELVMLGLAGTPVAGQVISFTPGLRGLYYPTFRDYMLRCISSYERFIEEAGGTPIAPRAQSADAPGSSGADPQRAAGLVLGRPTAAWPWSTLVQTLGGLKSVLAVRGLADLWGGPAPAGASEEQLYAVRQRWTVPLDVQHADLLRAVDGWANLLLGVDLLSADQLASRERMVAAVTHLNAVTAAVGRDANEFLVIASSAPEEDSRDTVVVSRATGAVVWLREGEVVRDYADVRAWIINVIGHHVTEIKTTPPVVDSPL